MRSNFPVGIKKVVYLLGIVTILLLLGANYEINRVPLTDPTYISHAKAFTRLNQAAIVVMLANIVAMLMLAWTNHNQERRENSN